MPSELKYSLNRWYWEGDPEDQNNRSFPLTADEIQNIRATRNRVNAATSFGQTINDLRCLVIHTNDGWMRRSIAPVAISNFRKKNIKPADRVPPNNIITGYHFYITGEASVYRSIDLEQPKRVFHASHVNSHSLGISVLSKFKLTNVTHGGHLQACSENTEDIPGRKLYLTSGPVHNEVTPCWWTTQNYNNATNFGRNEVNNRNDYFMFYNESQYRRLAILTRFILEKYSLPRNFPVLPHIRQINMKVNWDSFRRIVLADERAHLLMRNLYNLNSNPIRPSNLSFTPSDEQLDEMYFNNSAGLNESYKAGNQESNKRYTKWNSIFNLYRGIHGHEFSQTNRQDPGPLFDWHRFSREISDYWWYPFDLNGTVVRIVDDTVEMGSRNFRSYRRFNENTPILDYYWDEHENGARIYQAIEVPSIMYNQSTAGHLSPATFNFSLPDASTPASTPIYSMANGELVAVKLPNTTEDVSSGFVLIRHYVFQKTNEDSDTINYNQPPSVVYSLYMHLSRPDNMRFDQPNDHNPDWLNRILIRKKECELGIAFRNSPRGRNEGNHTGFAESRWGDQPPQRADYPTNPTTYEAWQHDNIVLEEFLTNLENGEVAMPITYSKFEQPVNIMLGDFIGDSGAIGNSQNGVRIEIFSPSFCPPKFGVSESNNGWNPNNSDEAAQVYISEWNSSDWWQAITHQMALDIDLPNTDRILTNTALYHFHPFEFMKWINNVTWKHEWPKYKVKDTNGNDVDCPPRPRTRRIPPAS